MIKSLTILVLLGALVGLGYFTRPTEESLQAVVNRQLQQQATTAASTVGRPADADAVLKDVTFKNRFLWIDAQKDGKTVFTGAFGHWFEWGSVLEAPAEKVEVKGKLPV